MKRASSNVFLLGSQIIFGAALTMGVAGVQGGCRTEVPLCAEHFRAETGRCEVSSVSCADADACPPTWTLAQAATACGGGLNEITIGACGTLNARKVSYGSPPLFGTCTYDPTDGRLAGITHVSDADQYCDYQASELSYGTVPLSCAPDPNALTVRCH